MAGTATLSDSTHSDAGMGTHLHPQSLENGGLLSEDAVLGGCSSLMLCFYRRESATL